MAGAVEHDQPLGLGRGVEQAPAVAGRGRVAAAGHDQQGRVQPPGRRAAELYRSRNSSDTWSTGQRAAADLGRNGEHRSTSAAGGGSAATVKAATGRPSGAPK